MRSHLLALLLALDCIGSSAQLASRYWPVVQTEHGPVRGAVHVLKRTTDFLGIPFAAPPTGANRFRPPQPPPAWQDVRDAQAFGPMCTQDLLGLDLPELVFGQEDCLFLNVFVPALARPNAELPVIRW